MHDHDSDRTRALKGVQEILSASQIETDPYEINILGRNFVVLPGVFSPRYFDDTEFFAGHVQIPSGGRFLEIGPGVGVVCVISALNGAAEVVGVDINAAAVKNTAMNARRHKVQDRVTVLVGDVYSALLTEKRFDLIYWNLPFGLTSNQNITILERSIMDPGYRSISRFFKEAVNYLTPQGKILFGFSPTVGNFERIKALIHEAKLESSLIAEKQVGEGDELITFQIFEAIPIQGGR